MTSASAVLRGGAIDNLGGQDAFSGPITLASPSTIAASAGTLTLNGNVNDVTFPLTVATGTAGDLIINGDLAGTGTVTKGTSAADTGTLTLNNSTNNYTGNTVVNGGTLAVNGLIPATNLLTVNNGSLVGNGSANSIDNLAPVSPNTAIISGGTNGTPGILNTGNLTLNSLTTVIADIFGTTPGTGYDQIISSGTVNLNGASLVLNVGDVANAPKGTQFTLITAAGGLTGSFANASGTIMTNGNLEGTISYNYTANTVVFTVTGIQALPPIITLPSAQNVNENSSLTLSSGNSISVNDLSVTNTSTVEELTLMVSHGTLSLGNTAVLTSVTGNNSADVVIEGTLANMNTALRAWSIRPPGTTAVSPAPATR